MLNKNYKSFKNLYVKSLKNQILKRTNKATKSSKLNNNKNIKIKILMKNRSKLIDYKDHLVLLKKKNLRILQLFVSITNN